MTSKSVILNDCCCFSIWLASVLLPDRFWLQTFLFRGQQHAPNVSHYQCENPPILLLFFLTSPCIRGNLIFHISFWFADVITRDAGSHATGRPRPLISLTTTNYEWRTTERNIERFHGNWHNGPSFLIPNVHWMFTEEVMPLFKLCYGVKYKRNNTSDDIQVYIKVHLSMPNKHHMTQHIYSVLRIWMVSDPNWKWSYYRVNLSNVTIWVYN